MTSVTRVQSREWTPLATRPPDVPCRVALGYEGLKSQLGQRSVLKDASFTLAPRGMRPSGRPRAERGLQSLVKHDDSHNDCPQPVKPLRTRCCGTRSHLTT